MMVLTHPLIKKYPSGVWMSYELCIEVNVMY